MKALLIIDYINEITHPEGKLASKGYSEFIDSHGTFENLNSLMAHFRSNNELIVLIKVAFEKSYPDHPLQSPLFGKAKEFNVLLNNTWATDFNQNLETHTSDVVILKNRIDAFHNTDLLETLREKNITALHIAGVATDLAVESTARSAHDHDFTVIIESTSCAAANQEDHDRSLKTLEKIAIIH